MGHIYAEVAARHGVDRPLRRLLNRQFAAAWQARKKFSHYPLGLGRIGRCHVSRPDRPGRRARPSSPSYTPVLPRRSLAHLRGCGAHAWARWPRAGFKLGVISNWDERLRPLLEQLKLADYFEAIVVSREVRASKPSRTIFMHAVRELGLPPEAVLHVGDSLSMDVRGARAAGLSALLLKRGARLRGRAKSRRCGSCADRLAWTPARRRARLMAGSTEGASAECGLSDGLESA